MVGKHKGNYRESICNTNGLIMDVIDQIEERVLMLHNDLEEYRRNPDAELLDIIIKNTKDLLDKLF